MRDVMAVVTLVPIRRNGVEAAAFRRRHMLSVVVAIVVFMRW